KIPDADPPRRPSAREQTAASVERGNGRAFRISDQHSRKGRREAPDARRAVPTRARKPAAVATHGQPVDKATVATEGGPDTLPVPDRDCAVPARGGHRAVGAEGD